MGNRKETGTMQLVEVATDVVRGKTVLSGEKRKMPQREKRRKNPCDEKRIFGGTERKKPFWKKNWLIGFG